MCIIYNIGIQMISYLHAPIIPIIYVYIMPARIKVSSQLTSSMYYCFILYKLNNALF